MKPGDVRVLSAGVKVVADDAETAIRVLRVAEDAVPAALEGLADELGDEVVLFRRLDVGLGILLSDGSLVPTALRDSLRAMLKAKLQRARSRGRQASNAVAMPDAQSTTAHDDDEAAWYPSLAVALGDYLRCVEHGRVTSWPQRMLSAYGHDWTAVLRNCVRDGPVFTGDVLAEVARQGLVSTMVRMIDPPVAATLLALWEGSAQPMTPTEWSAFPNDVREQVLARALHDLRAAGLLSPTESSSIAEGAAQSEPADQTTLSRSGEQAGATAVDDLAPLLKDPENAGLLSQLRASTAWQSGMANRNPWGEAKARELAVLALLAHLFSSWPPARGLRFAKGELAAAVEAATARTSGEAGRKQPQPDKRLVSQAGGLVFWATVLKDLGFEHSLVTSFPHGRLRKAVRWAIGRGLESASLPARDPLLLVWSGEAPDVAAFPLHALSGADPEPLHRLAIQTAHVLGYLDAPLRIVPFGRWLAVMGEQGLIVDALADVGGNKHDAIPRIVKNLASRGGGAPQSLEVSENLTTMDLDLISAIDVPALPDPWRPAVWAALSVVRAAAADRWKVVVSELRGWPAVVSGESHVELPHLRVEALAAGSWFRSPVRMGERDWKILVY